jgi:hypothetical protein
VKILATNHGWSPPLVIIDNLNVLSGSIFPSKADALLVVEPDAMLTNTPANQRFQPVSSGNTQVFQPIRRIQIT